MHGVLNLMLRERNPGSVRALELTFEWHHHQTMLLRFLFAVITKQTELPMLSEIPRDVASGTLRPSVCLTSCSLIRRLPDIFLQRDEATVVCLAGCPVVDRAFGIRSLHVIGRGDGLDTSTCLHLW